LRLVPPTEAQLEFVLAAEADPEAAPFIVQWSRERHLQVLDDPNHELLLAVEDGEPVGFVLLAGLQSEHRVIELRRVVVSDKGRGVGRRLIELVLDHAFGELGAHRVWLDVMPHNQRARRAYEAVGFIEEGLMRDALLIDGAYESLVVMSVLEPEWRARAG
jgi:diamine N-acetyltransferase